RKTKAAVFECERRGTYIKWHAGNRDERTICRRQAETPGFDAWERISFKYKPQVVNSELRSIRHIHSSAKGQGPRRANRGVEQVLQPVKSQLGVLNLQSPSATQAERAGEAEIAK